MPNISIKITNLSQIKSAFDSAPRLMSQELNIAIRKIVLSIGRQSRINSPVKTGRLRASHYERFGNLRGELGTNVVYDKFVHDGTKFMKGRPYLADAVDQSSTQTDDFFTQAVENVLSKIGRAT